LIAKFKALPAGDNGAEMVSDNVISTLHKIVCFQFDNGNLVKQDIVNFVFDSIPLQKDYDEA